MQVHVVQLPYLYLSWGRESPPLVLPMYGHAGATTARLTSGPRNYLKTTCRPKNMTAEGLHDDLS